MSEFFRTKAGQLIEMCYGDEPTEEGCTKLDCTRFHGYGVAFTLVFDPAFPPSVGSKRSLGLDVRSTISVTLPPLARAAIPTGVSWTEVRTYAHLIAEVQVRARSGLAKKHGITITNGIGTVDQDYRGEIHALITNLGDVPFEVKAGDKIAQLVATTHPLFEEMELFCEAKEERGAKGFGSTGV